MFYIFTMVYFYQRNIRWPIALNSAISLRKTSGPDSLIFFLFCVSLMLFVGLKNKNKTNLFVLLIFNLSFYPLLKFYFNLLYV